MTTELVQVSNEGHVAKILVNRPEALNSLSPEVLEALSTAVKSASSDEGVRAIVLGGAGGKAFVAGADVAYMQRCDDQKLHYFIELGHRVMRELEGLRVPVIAAVNGFALGGGLELAIACDIIVASPKAKFGAPEVKLGIVPGFGGTQRLFLRTGAGYARRLVFSGDIIDGNEAYRAGLVDILADDPESEAIKLAGTISERGPLAVSVAKRVMNGTLRRIFDHGFTAEIEGFKEVFRSADGKEGMRAFVEKRNPAFRGE